MEMDTSPAPVNVPRPLRRPGLYDLRLEQAVGQIMRPVGQLPWTGIPAPPRGHLLPRPNRTMEPGPEQSQDRCALYIFRVTRAEAVRPAGRATVFTLRARPALRGRNAASLAFLPRATMVFSIDTIASSESRTEPTL